MTRRRFLFFLAQQSIYSTAWFRYFSVVLGCGGGGDFNRFVVNFASFYPCQMSFEMRMQWQNMNARKISNLKNLKILNSEGDINDWEINLHPFHLHFNRKQRQIHLGLILIPAAEPLAWVSRFKRKEKSKTIDLWKTAWKGEFNRFMCFITLFVFIFSYIFRLLKKIWII